MPPLPAAQAADIVLGDRHGRTAAPALVDTAAAWLTQQGYRVTRNRPYAGGHSVELHGRPERACHAIQIEFDRQLYLESDGRTLSRNAQGVARLIAGLARVLQRSEEHTSELQSLMRISYSVFRSHTKQIFYSVNVPRTPGINIE